MTEFVIRGRGGGKTYAAVQWLKEDPDRRVIVTVDQDRAVEIRERYGLADAQVMSCDGKLQPPPRLHGRRLADFELAIEGADELLGRAFLFGVGLVTATGDCGHGADIPNPRPEPVVISQRSALAGRIDGRLLWEAQAEETRARLERSYPSSDCGDCGKRSYASFAFCPHCGTARTVLG